MHSFETLKKYVQLISLIVFFQHLIQNTDLKFWSSAIEANY